MSQPSQTCGSVLVVLVTIIGLTRMALMIFLHPPARRLTICWCPAGSSLAAGQPAQPARLRSGICGVDLNALAVATLKP